MKKLLGAAAILACIIGPAGAVPASVSGTPVAVEFAPDLTVDEIAIVVKKGWLNRENVFVSRNIIGINHDQNGMMAGSGAARSVSVVWARQNANGAVGVPTVSANGKGHQV